MIINIVWKGNKMMKHFFLICLLLPISCVCCPETEPNFKIDDLNLDIEISSEVGSKTAERLPLILKIDGIIPDDYCVFSVFQVTGEFEGNTYFYIQEEGLIGQDNVCRLEFQLGGEAKGSEADISKFHTIHIYSSNKENFYNLRNASSKRDKSYSVTRAELSDKKFKLWMSKSLNQLIKRKLELQKKDKR